MTTAYAYVEDGEINIRTVSPTIIAVKVNALGILFNRYADSRDSDQTINDLFGQYASPHGQIRRVTVEITPDATGE